MKQTKKTRLFIDAHCFDKEHQGTRAYIKRLYVGLSKSTTDFEFYFAAKNIENIKTEFKELNGAKFLKYKSNSSLVRLLIEIPYLIFKNKIDLAHFQYIVPFIKNCKFIVTTHDLLFMDFKDDFSFLYKFSRTYLFKRSLKISEIRTTVSEYSKQRIITHFNIQQNSILVTPNGVDENYLFLNSHSDSKTYIQNKFKLEKYVLYVSRFEPRKNHISLLKAFDELALYQKGYTLVLLGFTSIEPKEFITYYQNLGLEIKSKIFISEKINDSDLKHFYSAADLFVYPSKAEGYGLPPIEAGALGIPVICSNSTAMKDFTFFKEYHLDPNNYDVLKTNIEKILANPPTSNELLEISNAIHERYLFTNNSLDFLKAIENLHFTT